MPMVKPAQNDLRKVARGGGFAIQIATLSIILIAAALLLHRLFGMSTPVALNVVTLAFAGAGLAILISAVTLIYVWNTGAKGASSAIVAIGISGLLLLWPLCLIPIARQLPMINDVSTDLSRPPPFRQIKTLRAATPGTNGTDYNPAFAAKQRATYNDLQPLQTRRDPAEMMELVAQALRRLKMKIVSQVDPEGGRGAVGYIEAVDRTLVFGFYDDVVVRVTDIGRDTLVDVRSASRFGLHDFGANAKRVKNVLRTIVERIQATVPRRRRPRN